MADTVDRLLREFAADHVWVARHRRSLLKKFGDQWVAVKRQRVIAHARRFSELRKRLREPAYTCIEYISRRPVEMIL